MKDRVLVFLIWLLFLSGWVMNIVKLAKCDFEAPYKPEGIRLIGVFIPPVGMITGWMELKDGK